MHSELMRHFDKIDLIIIIQCLHCAFIDLKQVFDFSEFLPGEIDLKLETCGIECLYVDAFTSSSITGELPEYIFPFIRYFVGDDLLVILQRLEVEWSRWRINLHQVVIKNVAARSLVHRAVDLGTAREFFVFFFGNWLLNIVVKAEVNQFLQSAEVCFFQLHAFVLVLWFFHCLSSAFYLIPISNEIGC
jgi:hypothetical protein